MKKIAIIGVGGVARYAHLPSYKSNDIEVVALCDINKNLLEEVGKEFQIKKLYQDVDTMMNEVDIDIVDIATPPQTHLELIEKLIPYKKHIVMQKPLITDPKELGIVKLAIDRSDSFKLNMTGRYVDSWRKIKTLLDSKKYGNPLLCTITNNDWWDREPNKWDLNIDGYIVFEMLIHHLDLCLFWFGTPKKLTARGGYNPAQNIKKHNWISVMLEYKNGLIVQIIENWSMSEYEFSSGHPYEDILITLDNGAIKANSECVMASKLGKNSIDIWHYPRPGQVLPGENLKSNWLVDSFGVAMKDYIANYEKNKDSDKKYAALLTELTFKAYESLKSDIWVNV